MYRIVGKLIVAALIEILVTTCSNYIYFCGMTFHDFMSSFLNSMASLKWHSVLFTLIFVVIEFLSKLFVARISGGVQIDFFDC